MEREVREGVFGHFRTEVIVEHGRLGRILLRESFGGTDTLEGGRYSWIFGSAHRLQPDDTLESLRAEPWNEGFSLYDAVIEDRDPSRPALPLTPDAIRTIVRAAR